MLPRQRSAASGIFISAGLPIGGVFYELQRRKRHHPGLCAVPTGDDVHRHLLFTKTEKSVAVHSGRPQARPMAHLHERRGIRYERLDAHGAAGLCLPARSVRHLDEHRPHHRHLAELGIHLQTPPHLHRGRQQQPHHSGLSIQPV